MNDAKYIGLDVHQVTISAAVLDSTGKPVMESVLETKAATILQFIPLFQRGEGLLRQSVTTAVGEFLAALQNRNVITAVAGLQFFYPTNIHYDGPMDINGFRMCGTRFACCGKAPGFTTVAVITLAPILGAHAKEQTRHPPHQSFAVLRRYLGALLSSARTRIRLMELVDTDFRSTTLRARSTHSGRMGPCASVMPRSESERSGVTNM
jgi:hypothetical protein